MSRGDKFEAEAVDFVRMRLDDGPLARLRDRNQLDRDDKARNLALAQAGEKYRARFFPRRTRSACVRSIPSQEVYVGLFAQRDVALRKPDRSAAKIPRRARGGPGGFPRPLAAMVLEDREIVDVGREIGAYKDAKMAGAVALFILRRGLAALARHYRMISAPRAV